MPGIAAFDLDETFAPTGECDRAALADVVA